MYNSFNLNPEFVESFKTIKPKFGFNGLGELTFFRTYSRLKENGKNEQYFETIERVVNCIYSIQKEWIATNRLKWNEEKAQRSAQEMFRRIFEFKFTPAGRGFWALVPELLEKKGGMALHNCFDGETEFVTDEGLKKFKDVVGQELNVLTMDENYNKATVKSYGVQRLNKVILKPKGLRSNLELEYLVTPNHRWYLEDGSITTNLKIGDTILANAHFESVDKTSKDYVEGFTHGLIFGDGTKSKKYPKRHYIKVCDGDQDIYRPFLSTHKGYISETVGKDKYPLFTIISEEDLKALPAENKSYIYLKAFIEGWMSADSYLKYRSNTYCLDTQSAEAKDWIIKNCVYAGLKVTGVSVNNSDTNFGKRKNPLNRISLSYSAEYRVDSITFAKEDEVYCVEEPITTSFTLSSGICTGNCAFTSTQNIDTEYAKSFTFLMDVSMLGVGCGFDVKGAGKIMIKEPNKTDYVNVIEDTREAWVQSVETLINAYLLGDVLPVFDYSQIRPYGTPIKTFGGVASGPEPLIELHKNIIKTLEPLIESSLTETAIVDIMNHIGVCVVAGNVRRTAEIAFGNSQEFIDLKDYSKNPERGAWGWTSNNSIFAELGQDYTEVGTTTAINGEPGYFWLENAQKYGRMCDPINNKDKEAGGTNPCVEQTLWDKETCNLVETYPDNHDSLDDYMRTIKFAYLYSKTITLIPTHIPETNEVILRNRRIGLSQSGIAQFVAKHGLNTYKNWCNKGYETVQYYDDVYSNWFKIPKSIKSTSIKPSGTVSLLAGATPGMHFPESNFYIRRINIPKTSQLMQAVIAAGYYFEDSVYDKTNFSVQIPVSIKGVRTVNEVTAWEQSHLATFIQEYWADNQVSCTVTFQPNEAKDIPHILDMIQYKCKGISFLPKTDLGAYQQMPYEEVSEEKYNELVKDLKPMDFSYLGEDSIGEKFCTNDVCII